MSTAVPEIPLSGGTLSTVVRVGDTVRRTAGDWTPVVHALLRHVRARGFELAPEPLGWDESGREMLRYVPGETVGWSVPWPAWVRSDDVLTTVGRGLSMYHRAAADFRPPGEISWRSGRSHIGEGEIVCHNDLAPYNVVFAGGRLAAFIDWDLAGPGTALSDLAFVAWQWVPLHGPHVTSLLGWPEDVDRAGRLRRLLDSYGLEDRSGFIAAVEARVGYNRSIMIERAAAGDRAYAALVEQGHVAGMDEALAYLTRIGSDLQRQI